MIALLFVLLGLWLPMSNDPEARKRSMANLRKAPPAKRGNRNAVKHGARAKQPIGDVPKARTDMQRYLAARAPLRDKDGNLPEYDEPAMEILSYGFSRIRKLWAELDRLGPVTNTGRLRYALVREIRRSEKQLFQQLSQMGMTAQGRANLGLSLAATAHIQQDVRPNRTPERLMALAQHLAQHGLLPNPVPPVADVVEGEVEELQDEPDKQGRK